MSCRRCRLFPVAVILASRLAGAPIAWQVPVDVSSSADLDISGSHVAAVNVVSGGGTTQVTVAGEVIPFVHSGIAPTNLATSNYFTGDGGDTGDAGLNTILNSHGFSGSSWSFQLGNLEAGTEYQIQLIAAADTRSCCSSRNQRAGDDESPENVSGDFSRSGVGSVIGVFTASASTQTINILPGLTNGTDPGLSAYLLRTTPRAPTDIVLSNTEPVPDSLPGSLVGVLTATDPDQDDVHTYALIDSGSFPDNSLFTIDNGNELRVASQLGSAGETYSIRLRATDDDGLSHDRTFALVVGEHRVRLNEFLANTDDSSLRDEDGETSDWIELYNFGPVALGLDGYHLTDDPGELTKWTFPDVSIPADGYLLVFASSKDRRPTDGGELHTNFRLSADGEYLALVAPDGVTVISQFGTATTEYPEQEDNVTYGYFGDPLEVGFLDSPTPGGANSGGVPGKVGEPGFSVERGIHPAAFLLSITTDTPSASIRYTTDGSWPTETMGSLYTGPISVDRAMAVKAIAYRSGFISSEVETHTYIIPSAVLAQTSASVRSDYGFPTFLGIYRADYGMEKNPNADPVTHPTMLQDLATVPSLSIALDVDDMFGSSGIYVHPEESGEEWERRTSLELIDPADPTGEGDFQQNCAIRIQGGNFRSLGLTGKKSFRVLFKDDYGPDDLPTGGEGSLEYPMFGTAPGVAQEFETLIFRMESNDGWQWAAGDDRPQYARDEFGRRTQLALGHPSPHGRYLHLYINGAYWGVYNVVERPDSGFAESYIEDAEREEWEGQNSGTPINDTPNLDEWNSLVSIADGVGASGSEAASDAAFLEACGFNPDGSRNPSFSVWFDPDNHADYFITNWYGGNNDWPHKNYYGGISRVSPRSGYKYFLWDSEVTLFLSAEINDDQTGDYRGIAAPNEGMRVSPEYRMRFGDRVHRALFNDGALTPAAAQARYDEITADHASILNPEAARWGNQHDQARSLTDWQDQYDHISTNWFPFRGKYFVSSLRAAGLYPDLGAPTYSQHGGAVAAGSGPSLIVPTAVTQIYYRFGGGDDDPDDYGHSLDPRLIGGGIHPAASLITLPGGETGTVRFITSGDEWKYLDDGSDQGTEWKEVGFDDSAWDSGPSQLGYGDGDESTVVGFIDTVPFLFGTQKNATTYFRTTFEVADPTQFADFTLDYLYDDGVVVYLNGLEIARRNLPPAPAYDQFTGVTDGDDAPGVVTLQPSDLVAGTNTLAVEVHQEDAGTTDMSFDLMLTGNPPGGDLQTSPVIPLTGSGWLLSRSYDSSSGEWSALNQAFFTVDTEPASADNLVISEFNYHPAEPTTPAELAVSSDRDDFEFIELMNVSSVSIDLTGVAFTDGISMIFADSTVLAPGERLVGVKDPAAFAARYPGLSGVVRIATDTLGNDSYGGRLSNGGERLTLLDAAGGVIHDFVYDDELPWPLADGSGFSLVLKSPASPIPDHGVAGNWVASNAVGGAPGSQAEFGFPGVDEADDDHDGYPALVEYALGTSDSIGGDAGAAIVLSRESYLVEGETGEYLTITFPRNLYAQNAVAILPEISDDLSSWSSVPDVVWIDEMVHPDGTATVTYRSAVPIGSQPRAFMRLRATE